MNLFVGNLPESIYKQSLESEFRKWQRKCWNFIIILFVPTAGNWSGNKRTSRGGGGTGFLSSVARVCGWATHSIMAGELRISSVGGSFGQTSREFDIRGRNVFLGRHSFAGHHVYLWSGLVLVQWKQAWDVFKTTGFEWCAATGSILALKCLHAGLKFLECGALLSV